MSGCERVLAALSDGRWHPHQELYNLGVVLHSRISDLRKRGHNIEMRRVRARYDRRQWTWFYRLAPLSESRLLPEKGRCGVPDLGAETAGRDSLSGVRTTTASESDSLEPVSTLSPEEHTSMTPASLAAAAAPPEASSALSLFDMPAVPAWN